jgi:uncharacterized coiled-coil protein SlyX
MNTTNHPSSTSTPVKVTYNLFCAYYHDIDHCLDKLNFLVQAIPDEEYGVGIGIILETLEDMSAFQEEYMEKASIEKEGQHEDIDRLKEDLKVNKKLLSITKANIELQNELTAWKEGRIRFEQ